MNTFDWSIGQWELANIFKPRYRLPFLPYDTFIRTYSLKRSFVLNIEEHAFENELQIVIYILNSEFDFLPVVLPV